MALQARCAPCGTRYSWIRGDYPLDWLACPDCGRSPLRRTNSRAIARHVRLEQAPLLPQLARIAFKTETA
jgi:hypothetical protein